MSLVVMAEGSEVEAVAGASRDSAAPATSGSVLSTAPKWPESEPTLGCDQQRGWRPARCGVHGGRRWLPIRCRQCAGCLRLRLVKHQARIAAGLLAVDGGRVYVVLSSPLDASWPDVMAWFKRWVKAVRRYAQEQGWGGPVEYAWTKEEGHRNGMKHLNVLITGWGYIDHSLLKSWWVRSSSGRAEVLYVTERVRGGRLDLNSDAGVRHAVRYVSKYVTKEGVQGERMVGYSGGWPRVVEEREECRWVIEGDDIGMAVPPSGAVGVTASGAVVVGSRSLVHGPCAAPSEPWESLHLWLYRKARAPGAGPLPVLSRSRSRGSHASSE